MTFHPQHYLVNKHCRRKRLHLQ